MLRKCLIVTALVALSAFSGSQHGALLFGQDAKDKKTKGRLPPYYSDIVSEDQRQKIYDVQARYAKQIDALTEQLSALEKQRDRDIENVLNAEQKQKLKKAQDEAAAKKKKTSADKKGAPEEGKSAAKEARPAAPAETKKLKSK